jgi:hypothetical protein
MVDEFYPNHVGTYECEVLGGIPTDKVPAMKSLAYHNNCDVLRLELMPESNGYQWRMEVVAPNNYVGARLRDIAIKSEYASYANLVDPRAEEKINQYIR